MAVLASTACKAGRFGRVYLRLSVLASYCYNYYLYYLSLNYFLGWENL